MNRRTARGVTEHQALTTALRALDQPTPCQLDPARWYADDLTVRAQAADACLDCPIFRPCGAYAAAAGERFGVWAGTDRTATIRREAA